jgi:hypothetical protein
MATRPGNVGVYDVRTGQWRPSTAAEDTQAYATRDQRNASTRKAFVTQAALSSLGVLGGGLAAGAFAAGGPAVVGGAGGGVLNTAAGSGGAWGGAAGGTMGIPWNMIGQVGAQTFGTIYGAHKQNQAQDKSLRATQVGNDQATQLAMAQLEEQKAQNAALQKQWEATQQFEADKWKAMEDDRLFNRRILEDTEARKAQRRARADALLAELGGLGTLGNYARRQ